MLPDGPGSGEPPIELVSDAERDAAATVLRHHFADGRLSLDEFSDRVGEAYAARTKAELDTTLRHLPVPHTSTELVETTGDSSQSRISTTIAIMGGTQRTGRWRPAAKMTAVAIMGGCEIDLRGAEVRGEVLEITAVAIMGGVDVIVPEGVKVIVNGTPIMGSVECKVADVPRIPGTPLVRVTAIAIMGGVAVKSRRRKPASAGEPDALAPGARSGDSRSRDRDGHRGGERGRPRDRVRDRHDDRARARGERRGPSDPGTAVLTGEPLANTSLPDFADGIVTVMFSDIEDFTGLTEKLGDRRAHEVLEAHNRIVREQLARHGGHEVKAQGDGFMIAFSGARRALHCAIATQRALADHGVAFPDERVSVRIGIHAGEAITANDDLYGRTVILAARIGAEATGGEILVSGVLRDLVEASHEFQFTGEREVALKGIPAAQRLSCVSWRPV